MNQSFNTKKSTRDDGEILSSSKFTKVEKLKNGRLDNVSAHVRKKIMLPLGMSTLLSLASCTPDHEVMYRDSNYKGEREYNLTRFVNQRGEMSIYNSQTGEEVFPFKFTYFAKVSSDGVFLLSRKEETILYDAQNKKILKKIVGEYKTTPCCSGSGLIPLFGGHTYGDIVLNTEGKIIKKIPLEYDLNSAYKDHKGTYKFAIEKKGNIRGKGTYIMDMEGNMEYDGSYYGGVTEAVKNVIESDESFQSNAIVTENGLSVLKKDEKNIRVSIFYNNKGEEILRIPEEYQTRGEFISENLFVIYNNHIPDSELSNAKHGLMNLNGKVILEPNFKEISIDTKYIYAIESEMGRTVIADKFGKTIIKMPVGISIQAPIDGQQFVCSKVNVNNEKPLLGIIDIKGKQILEFNYRSIYSKLEHRYVWGDGAPIDGWDNKEDLHLLLRSAKDGEYLWNIHNKKRSAHSYKTFEPFNNVSIAKHYGLDKTIAYRNGKSFLIDTNGIELREIKELPKGVHVENKYVLASTYKNKK